jgi:hypothetical protein
MQYGSTIYEIYDNGMVWSTYKWGFLELQVDKDGYNIASIYVNGRMVKTRVCRMVAETYIPNPDNLPQVNHKDGNKQNDDHTNLEWSTNSDNMKHACAMGLVDKSHLSEIGKIGGEYAINNTGRRVEQLDGDIIIAQYRSVGEASRATGAYKSDIRKVCDGRQKSANKCKFRWEGSI